MCGKQAAEKLGSRNCSGALRAPVFPGMNEIPAVIDRRYSSSILLNLISRLKSHSGERSNGRDLVRRRRIVPESRELYPRRTTAICCQQRRRVLRICCRACRKSAVKELVLNARCDSGRPCCFPTIRTSGLRYWAKGRTRGRQATTESLLQRPRPESTPCDCRNKS